MINITGFEKEYAYIRKVYGVQKAKRSGVLYINHIDEGLVILEHLKADNYTKGAYCLHGALQEDNSLYSHWQDQELQEMPLKSIILAIEYRNIANAYLSTRSINNLEEIALSPISEVQQMLIADKIQNYKDLKIYHKEHPRFFELDLYFQNWFSVLGISKNQKELIDLI